MKKNRSKKSRASVPLSQISWKLGNPSKILVVKLKARGKIKYLSELIVRIPSIYLLETLTIHSGDLTQLFLLRHLPLICNNFLKAYKGVFYVIILDQPAIQLEILARLENRCQSVDCSPSLLTPVSSSKLPQESIEVWKLGCNFLKINFPALPELV